jgi:hypothetical protein
MWPLEWIVETLFVPLLVSLRGGQYCVSEMRADSANIFYSIGTPEYM